MEKNNNTAASSIPSNENETEGKMIGYVRVSTRAGPYRTAEEAQAFQRLHHFLHQNPLWVLRGVVRLKGLAQHRPLPQGHLAVQRQVRRQGASVFHSAPDRGRDQGGVHPGGEQTRRRPGVAADRPP